MPARRTVLALLALLVAAGGAAACGGGDDEGNGGASGDGGGDGLASEGDAPEPPDDAVVIDGTAATVQSLDNTFRAPDIQVEPGTTVTWTNDGRNEHDVLPVEGDAWGVEVDELPARRRLRAHVHRARGVRLLLLDPRHHVRGHGRLRHRRRRLIPAAAGRAQPPFGTTSPVRT